MGKQTRSLCWNCKRALGKPECRCSWSYDFTPVDGWKGEKIIINNKSQKDEENNKLAGKVNSFRITECPLYIKKYEFESAAEVAEEVIKELNITQSRMYKYPKQCILEYEKKTKKQLPAWYKIGIINE